MGNKKQPKEKKPNKIKRFGPRRPPLLTRQDTVYGVEDLPEAEVAEIPIPDPNIPSTSTGVTAADGLILSHTQIHLSTDSSSDYCTTQEKKNSEDSTELPTPTCLSLENYTLTDLDLIQTEKPNSPVETESSVRCSCFRLQKCKKHKGNKKKDKKKDKKK